MGLSGGSFRSDASEGGDEEIGKTAEGKQGRGEKQGVKDPGGGGDDIWIEK